MTPNQKETAKPDVLQVIRITIEPERFMNDGAVSIRVCVQGKNGKRFETCQIVENDHFKSIGEEAFDRAVKQMKREMGWRT